MKIHNEVLPTSNKTLADMYIGDVARILPSAFQFVNDYVLRTYSGWVNLSDPQHTWALFRDDVYEEKATNAEHNQPHHPAYARMLSYPAVIFPRGTRLEVEV